MPLIVRVVVVATTFIATVVLVALVDRPYKAMLREVRNRSDDPTRYPDFYSTPFTLIHVIEDYRRYFPGGRLHVQFFLRSLAAFASFLCHVLFMVLFS